MVSTHLSFSALLLLGPTASGKTAFAHSLADELAAKGVVCELVNLDAFQVYKELNAGTAKPTSAEILKYHYHFVDILSISQTLDAQTFAKMAWDACQQISARGHLPLCVGGSGLYVRAFLHGLDDLPPRNDILRGRLRSLAQRKGWPWCHRWLSRVDPQRARELHQNDGVRIERALEVYLLLKKPISSLFSRTHLLKEQKSLFPCAVVHFEPSDELLRERIRARVPVLFAKGWLQEVRDLFQIYGDKIFSFYAMGAIGYRELLLLDKEDTAKIETQTWQYAKRQRTWNAKEKKDYSVKEGRKDEVENLIEFLFTESFLQIRKTI